MAKRSQKKKKSGALPVIWTITDEMWQLIEPVLVEDAPPCGTGRPRADWRRILNGILFRLRTGCQWNKLPTEFGDDSTVHRWFQRWNKNGVMERLWAVMVRECEDLGGVFWKWQSADGAMSKARFGGEKNRPQSHGSRQTRHETQRAGGRTGRPVVGGHRWGECA
jgi:putative transposase